MKRWTALLLAFSVTAALFTNTTVYAADEQAPAEAVIENPTGEQGISLLEEPETKPEEGSETKSTEKPETKPEEGSETKSTEKPETKPEEGSETKSTEKATEKETEKKSDEVKPALSDSLITINIYGLDRDEDGFFSPKNNSIHIQNVPEKATVNWVSKSEDLLVGEDEDHTFSFYPKEKGMYTVDFYIGETVLTCQIEVLNACITFVRDSKSLNDGIGKNWISGATTLCLYPKETTTLKIKKKGIPDDGIPIKWESSDKNIAVVTQQGTITAKNYGYTDITVSYKTVTATYRMAVTYKTAAKALRYAAKHYHSTYSQPKRMWKNYYDCSSYVWRSYKAVGKKIGDPSYTSYAPTAAELARWTTRKKLNIIDGKMDPSKMLPGDILFETGAGNGRFRGIYHIDFYTGYGMRMTVARSKDYIEPGTVIVARPCMGTPSKPSAQIRDGKIEISWNGCTSFGATGYYIYRKTGSGKYKKIKKIKKKTIYTDTSAAAGKNYKYKIRPYWTSKKTFQPKYSKESASIHL